MLLVLALLKYNVIQMISYLNGRHMQSVWHRQWEAVWEVALIALMARHRIEMGHSINANKRSGTHHCHCTLLQTIATIIYQWHQQFRSHTTWYEILIKMFGANILTLIRTTSGIKRSLHWSQSYGWLALVLHWHQGVPTCKLIST